MTAKTPTPPGWREIAHTKTVNQWCIALGVSHRTIRAMCEREGVSCAVAPSRSLVPMPENWAEIAPTKTALRHALDYAVAEDTIRKWCAAVGVSTLRVQDDPWYRELRSQLASAGPEDAETILDSLHRDTRPHLDDPYRFYRALRAFSPQVTSTRMVVSRYSREQ